MSVEGGGVVVVVVVVVVRVICFSVEEALSFPDVSKAVAINP